MFNVYHDTKPNEKVELKYMCYWLYLLENCSCKTEQM